jgi:hypothetical protein
MRLSRLPELDRDPACFECQEDDYRDCADPCGHGFCRHKAHCEVCGRGLDYQPRDGVCVICDAEWEAAHQLLEINP